MSPEQAAELHQDVQDVELNDSDRAAFYYARLIALSEAGRVSATGGGSLDLHARDLRQTFARIVDSQRAGIFELRLLAITALPLAESDPLAAHSANVAVLALAMGRLLGLGRGPLGDLAFAAFAHDLGRSEAGGAGAESSSSAGFRKLGPDGRTEDSESRYSHVVRGVALALRSHCYDSAALLRLIISQEHHRAVDRYPGAASSDAPHAMSRIVGIADAFDKLEHGTPWAPAMSPALALEALEGDAASAGSSEVENRYDPTVVRLLKDVLGAVPRGSLLRLRDRSVAVVVDGGARRGNRPIARRLLGADGRPDARTPLFEVDRRAIEKHLAPTDVSADWRKALVR